MAGAILYIHDHYWLLFTIEIASDIVIVIALVSRMLSLWLYGNVVVICLIIRGTAVVQFKCGGLQVSRLSN